jgi:hypothetical protein
LEKTNKSHREAITGNNRIFRQRMGALSTENAELKSNLEEAQKTSAAIAEERDALKAAAATAQPPTSTSSEPQTEELERLRQEKVALEQALREEKAKPLVQAPAPITPDTSEHESRLVGCSSATSSTHFFSNQGLINRLLLRRNETSFSEKRRLGISPAPRLRKRKPSGRAKRLILSRAVMKPFCRPR